MARGDASGMRTDWNPVLRGEFDKPYWNELTAFVADVRARQAASHAGKGWETFTDEVIRVVNAKDERVVFILWGGYARKKRGLIDTSRHAVIESAHPSPLSAHNGFFGSRPFSRANAAL